MGCGASSGITIVEPVKTSSDNVNEHNLLDVQRPGGGERGDSAVSSHTTDSGLGLESAEGVILPGAVPRQLPPLRANSVGPPQNSTPPGRQESSEILEQLLSQGIIPAQSRSASNGESYSILMEEVERPRRRPPARLEKLLLRKEQAGPTRQEIDDRMRQAEERRQNKEDAMRVRLRTKSARPRQTTSPAEGPVDPDPDQEQEHTVVEDLRLDSFSEPHSPPKSPEALDNGQPPKARPAEREEGGGESGRGGLDMGDTDKTGSHSPLTAVVTMETDSTFQQIEDIEEIF